MNHSSLTRPPINCQSRLGIASGLIGFLLLASCAFGPNYRPPQTNLNSTFAVDGAFDSNGIEIEWWRLFNDAQLNGLVEKAITTGTDVRFATARLREARALRNEIRFDLLPTVRSDNYYVNQLSSTAALPGFNRGQRQGEFYHTGFDATWEMDLFGRVRRSVEAASADLESIEATLHDVIVSLISETARNYLELRGLQAQLDVAKQNATNQTDSLKLAQDRLAGGAGTQLDVARAEAQLRTTLASIPPLEAAIQRTLNRLAVLGGEHPMNFGRELRQPEPLPSAPAIVSLGNPEQLLRRRPDIRAAERSLAAATARIGVAVADLFPRVTFNGSIGLEGETFSRLGDAGADTWSFGPRISWAALDLGRVYQRLRAADARAEAALAFYDQTVLLALEETDNALVSFSREQVRRDQLRLAVAAGQQAADLSRQRYRDGVTDFLAVLDAERVLLDLQDSLAQSETRTSTALIAVYKALGGGWENFGNAEASKQGGQ